MLNQKNPDRLPLRPDLGKPAQPNAVAVAGDKDKVRIRNAPAGFTPVIGLPHARRWVKQGRAEFVAGDLLLKPSFRKAILKSLAHGPQLEGGGYDSVQRSLTNQEMRNLPMVGPVRKLYQRRNR